MILTVDIGNTSIHLGLFERGKLRKQVSLPTHVARSQTELTRWFRRVAPSPEPRAPSQAIICSVVPWATPAMARALRAAGVGQVRVVGKDLKVPLKNRYRYPRQVGQDRLVGAYAAWSEFGDGALRRRAAGRSPERARKRESRGCIVCDFGTAITIDVVTKAGEYLGGVIAPGLEISLEALASRTALLPKVELKEPPELLGRDTANSIRSGILYGSAALCDGLTARLKRQYAPKAVVVATGGASPLIAKQARTIDHLRPNLVLEGLLQLSQL